MARPVASKVCWPLTPHRGACSTDKLLQSANYCSVRCCRTQSAKSDTLFPDCPFRLDVDPNSLHELRMSLDGMLKEPPLLHRWGRSNGSQFGVSLATPNPWVGEMGQFPLKRRTFRLHYFTMCREWHPALLLSRSCWLGLSTLCPYGRAPAIWGTTGTLSSCSILVFSHAEFYSSTFQQ